MNIEKLESRWEDIKGQVKEKWGKLTKDDILVIKGKKEQLQAKLKERYGYTAHKADSEIASFMRDCNCGEVETNKKSLNSKEHSRA